MSSSHLSTPINHTTDYEKGWFQEKSGKRYFEFHSIETLPYDCDLWLEWGEKMEATHVVRVSDTKVGSLPGRMSPFRFARVLKTVAYILSDEDENGNAVWQKWSIAWK